MSKEFLELEKQRYLNDIKLLDEVIAKADQKLMNIYQAKKQDKLLKIVEIEKKLNGEDNAYKNNVVLLENQDGQQIATEVFLCSKCGRPNKSNAGKVKHEKACRGADSKEAN